MAEVKESPAVESNPLYRDTALFYTYMAALDQVVANAEIRVALDEFRLSPHALRMVMIRRARQVLMSAPREFAAYEAALGVAAGMSGSQVRGTHAVDFNIFGVIIPALVPDDEEILILRWLSWGIGAVGLVILVAGAASISVAPWMQSLVWAGALLAVAGALLHGLLWLAGRAGLSPARSQGVLASIPALARARDQLMAAVSDDEFLARARTFINIRRQDQMGQTCDVVSIVGLSETFDSTYQVPTSTADELEDLVARLDGASIGVAGPRGSGKSTLVRSYCHDPATSIAADPGRRTGIPGRVQGDLRCMVTAPVEYAPRDFVLHLFAEFCRAVIRRYAARKPDAPRARFPALAVALRGMRPSPARVMTRVIAWGACAAALLWWQHPGDGVLALHGSWALYTAIAIVTIGNIRLATVPGRLARHASAQAQAHHNGGPALVTAARRHLARVRYLQTHTSGWSGTLGFPGGTGQYSRGSERAEQPLSYPEIVGEFRDFAREVAADLHGRGNRIFVGIDELDKIGTADQAERFLNEIKGIFGISHLYFIVSVSDDALTAFERRGLPLRDAFDSSFDEIIHVGPLTYGESRRLLYRRVIGLTEPYVALCHCLAGGLARDLVRAARQVTRVQQALGGGSTRSASDDEAGADNSTAYLLFRQAPARQPPTLTAVCAAVVRDELRRKAQAVAHVANNAAPGQAQDLHATVHSIIRDLASTASAMKIVDIVSRLAPGEPSAVTSLRLDLAAFAYYCATVQDVFNSTLSTDQLVTATTTPAAPGSIDALAAARHAFTLDTQLAWQSITQFRKAWQMETRDPPTPDSMPAPIEGCDRASR